MKTRHYLSIIACLTLSVSGCDNMTTPDNGKDPDVPEVNYEVPVFADENFEAHILENFDTDEDGTISESEAAAIVDIEYSEATAGVLSSLEGTGSFYNLKSFKVATDSDIESTVTSIDFSNNKKLETIDIPLETLEELNLDGLTTLKEINIAFSAISELDVTAFADLEVLRAHNSELTSIDLTNNAKLTDLSVYGTPITELNTSSCPALKTLAAGSGDLTSLTLNNPNLVELTLANGIADTEVDFSSLVRLERLLISNAAVREISLPQSASLTYVFGNKFPNLETLDFSAASKLNTLLIGEYSKLKTVRLNQKVEGKFTFNGYWDDDEYVNVNIEYVENDDIELDDYSTLIIDENAKAAVIEACDEDNDNQISKTELNAVTELDLSEHGITTAEGLEVFPLEILDISGNELTEFDATAFPNLTRLDISGNRLTEISVKGLQSLEYLDVSHNSLSTDLDYYTLSSSLKYLYASNNPELTVDPTDNSDYIEVDISNTATAAMYLTYWKSATLTSLNLAGTKLTGAIKLPGMTALKTLNVSNTAITSVDITDAATNGSIEKILATNSSLELVIVGPGNSLAEDVIEGADDCGVLNVTNPSKDIESNMYNYITAFTASTGASEKDFTVNYTKTSKGFIINAGGEASITVSAGRKVLKFFAIGVNGTPSVEVVRSTGKPVLSKSQDQSSWGESYKSSSENPLTVRNNAAAASDDTKLLIDGDADWHKFNLGLAYDNNATEEGETITFKVTGNEGEKVIIFGINLSSSRDDEE